MHHLTHYDRGAKEVSHKVMHKVCGGACNHIPIKFNALPMIINNRMILRSAFIALNEFFVERTA